jgi:hypothetical protein
VTLSTREALCRRALRSRRVDAMHNRRGLDTSMPRWYVPLCIGFDVVVAFYVVIRF